MIRVTEDRLTNIRTHQRAAKQELTQYIEELAALVDDENFAFTPHDRRDLALFNSQLRQVAKQVNYLLSQGIPNRAMRRFGMVSVGETPDHPDSP